VFPPISCAKAGRASGFRLRLICSGEQEMNQTAPNASVRNASKLPSGTNFTAGQPRAPGAIVAVRKVAFENSTAVGKGK